MPWHDSWHMGGMWLWWILLVVLASAAIWYVLLRRGSGSFSDSPEQVVKRRYANGEIDRDTYERILADLRR